MTDEILPQNVVVVDPVTGREISVSELNELGIYPTLAVIGDFPASTARKGEEEDRFDRGEVDKWMKGSGLRVI